MPAGIERLVLVSTTPRFLAAPGWPYGTAAGAARRGSPSSCAAGDAQAIDEFCKLQVRGNTPRTAARVLKSAARRAHSVAARSPRRSLHGLERLRNADLRPALSMVRVPTLVIARQRTTASCARPPRARWPRSPDARYVEFAGAAHAPFLSHPKRFAEVGGRLPAWLSRPSCSVSTARRCAAPSTAPARATRAPRACRRGSNRNCCRASTASDFEPQVVLDLGAGTGRASARLKRRYPRARVIALDLSLGMLTEARRHQRLWRRFARVCADAQRLPLAGASVDLVFSNLMLQWCQPLDAAFAEVRRVLKPAGFFAFSTFGPATLQELRAAWAAADDLNHVNHFIDVHDVGEALRARRPERAGARRRSLRGDYPDALALMRELKTIGAHNVTAGRPRTLRGRARLARMQHAYEAARREGVLPATFEVIYGAAWGAPGAPRSAGAPAARCASRRARSDGGDRDAARGLFVTGTDTGVGKTLVACALVRGTRRLGAAGRGHEAGRLRCRAHAAGPAQRRRAGTGRLRQRPEDYAGRESFLLRTGQFRRISQQKRPEYRIDIDRILQVYRGIAARADWVIVEGAGGWLAPLGERESMADLPRTLGLPVLLVVGLKLGCLNQAQLTHRAIAGGRRGLRRLGGERGRCGHGAHRRRTLPRCSCGSGNRRSRWCPTVPPRARRSAWRLRGAARAASFKRLMRLE